MAFPFGAFSGIEKSVLRKTRANDEFQLESVRSLRRISPRSGLLITICPLGAVRASKTSVSATSCSLRRSIAPLGARNFAPPKIDMDLARIFFVVSGGGSVDLKFS